MLENVEFDVRSIAVTNIIAKIAEKFVFFNDFYNKHTDINQFGCVRGRSAALLK